MALRTNHPTRRKVLVNTVVALSDSVVSLPLTGVAGAAPKVHQVKIRKFKFSPQLLKVKLGDTVTWTNEDIAPHTATANDKSWSTGRLKKGQSESIIVKDAMSTDYFCKFHPNMKASLKLTV